MTATSYAKVMLSTHILVFKDKNNLTTEVLSKKTLSIGRSASDDIFLASEGVSRTHATIQFINNNFWIVDGDLNGQISTNGLYINGKRVSSHKLNPYDVITFCKGTCAIFLACSNQLEFAKNFETSIKHLVKFLSRKEQLSTRLLDRNYKRITKPTFNTKPRISSQDDLTKLPNRSAFLTRAHQSLQLKKENPQGYQFAIFFIDVDRFKMINDSLGHLAGDKFLIEISERLRHCLRPGDMVARLGGDEFAILLDNLHSPSEAVSVAKRIQEYSAKPLRIEKQELYPSLSIGIALSYLEYQTVEEIMRDADTAMYHAKDSGRSRFIVFDQEMHQKAIDLLKLHGDLRKALEHKELQLYYQPIVSLNDRALIGFEALIRWNHPERGLINPDIFISIAEETNLIYQVGQWVIEEACRQLSLWKKNPTIQASLSINVNLSSKQLSDTYLVEKIRSTLTTYDISPNELKLEVTESIVMENSQYSINIFSQLKQLGIHLAIDDFGTGYSSLSYLNRFPIDTLKVDRSFIADIDKSHENTSISITQSIIGLAHSLGVKVVAEGIENAYHLACLQRLKCDYGQGFLFAKPLNAQEATSFAEQGLQWAWK